MEIHLGEYVFDVDPIFDKCIQYHRQFAKLAVEGVEAFIKQSAECHSLSTLCRLFDKYIKIAHKMSGDLACKCLFDSGIYTINTELFLNEYQEEYMDVTPYIESIVESVEAIQDKDAEYRYHSMLKDASRGRWQGGGFGIGGALKGAVTAGALNLAGDTFHGITGALAKACHNTDISDMENAVFHDPDTKYSMQVAIFECVLGGFWALYDELEDQGIRSDVRISRDEAHALSENATKYATNPEQKLELLVKAVFSDPFDFELFESLIVFAPSIDGAEAFARKMGIDLLISENQKIENMRKLQIIRAMPQKNIEDEYKKLTMFYVAENTEGIKAEEDIKTLENLVLSDSGKHFQYLEKAKAYIVSKYPKAKYVKSERYVQVLSKRIWTLKKQSEKDKIFGMYTYSTELRQQKILKLIEYADHYKEPVDDEVLETVKDVMTTFTYRKIEQKEFADLCRAIEATGKKDVIPKAYEVLLEKSGLQKEEFREKTEIEQPNGEAECDDSIIDDEIRRLLEDIPQEEPKPRKEIVSHKANNVTESNKTVDDLFATKSKGFAGFIGTLLGPFAFHWFYLGKWGRAVLYILILILTMNYDRAISEVFIRFCVLEGLTLFCCTKKFALRYIRNSFTTVWFYVLVVAAVFSPLLLQYV